jgi:hypothetical protein
MDSDLRLHEELERARAKQAGIETDRRHHGGIYDPILGRWVSAEETADKCEKLRRRPA